jgi:hypothetical protein
VVDSLKVLDLEWPIREADMRRLQRYVGFVPKPDLGVPIEFFKASGRVSGTASAAAHQQ